MSKRKTIPANQTPPEQIRVTVENWEIVSKFLRNLAEQIAVVPGISSEIMRSSVLVAQFLEDRARTTRTQHPKEFVDAPKEPEVKRGRVAARRGA